MITKKQTKNNCEYVTKELFDTFYNDYSDSKHYINDILNILNERNTTSTKKTSVSEQILLLEEHVRILKLENKKLQEERKSQLNIIERLTENQDSDLRKETRNDFFFLSGFFFHRKTIHRTAGEGS